MGRIEVRSLDCCLERYQAELLYGSTAVGKAQQTYLELLKQLWDDLAPKAADEANRIEFGCWCVDEPNTPAIKLSETKCHTQLILKTIQDRILAEDEKIPENIYIVNVKKACLTKRGRTADEWVADPNTYYLGYKMPFLPFENHSLRNIYKVAPVKVAGKKRSRPANTKTPTAKKK